MELNKYLDSKVNRKIIKFYLENPSSIDTSRGIATWINEDINKTEKALEELAKAKILIRHGNDATSAYGYTTDTHIISKTKIGLERIKTKKRKMPH